MLANATRFMYLHESFWLWKCFQAWKFAIVLKNRQIFQIVLRGKGMRNFTGFFD